MLKSYQAVVEKDHIQWLGHIHPITEKPIRVLVVIESVTQKKSKISSDVLKESRGVLGKASIHDLDKKLANLRKDWDFK